ncbi:MAG: ROK family protein [Calditrichaeota bacterium]|nr:ROK family protein [Calditrichota bacterium]
MHTSDQNPSSSPQTPAFYIALDIGGSKILAARGDARGQLLERLRAETPLALEAGLDLLRDMTAQLCDGAVPQAIGAAIGGPLDYHRGIVSPLHQPEWREVPLKAIMESAFNCPFYVDVDTNAAAFGEYHLGDCTSPRLLYLTLSTGMGGGLLLDGRIYRGMNDAHPEVGHQAIPFRCAHPERVHCECGAPDCLEGLISGNAIRRIYRKPAEQLTPAEWEEVGYNLGQGLRNLAAIYAPEVILLGGGVAIGAGEKLLAPARQVLRKHLRLVPVPQIRMSSLGYDAALTGALALAIHGAEFHTAIGPD